METNTNSKIDKFNEDDFSPIARLVQLGREKSFITIDDILRFFPEPERDMEQTDRIFATLLTAGIPFIDGPDNNLGENPK
jgi:RNA polymerase primary sigma factor